MEPRRYDMGPPSARVAPTSISHQPNSEPFFLPPSPASSTSQKRSLEGQTLPADLLRTRGPENAVHVVADAVATAEAASSLLGLAAKSGSGEVEHDSKRQKHAAPRSMEFQC